MCRLLCVKSQRPFSIIEQLMPFAGISKASREFQGHGWGCSWRSIDSSTGQAHWTHYHNVNPIWEDGIQFDRHETTDLLIAHARSAFRDEGIQVENNMPFTDDHYVFAFNGELRGVRIKEEGRIGAEKIFNYIKRFENESLLGMLDKGTRIINRRTRYVRAMNIILSNGSDVVVSSHFGEDPDYFQMHRTIRDDRLIVCSDPWDDAHAHQWQTIPRDAVIAISC